MIELQHIDKYYNIGTVNEVCLFKDFNLTIHDGDFISVIGSNGSGKTSLLNLIHEVGSVLDRGSEIVLHVRVISFGDFFILVCTSHSKWFRAVFFVNRKFVCRKVIS